MDTKKFPYWLTLEESKLVRFEHLAHLMAKAFHPSDAEAIAYGSARLNLDDELPRAVQSGDLIVRNASGLGKHTFPLGDALQRSVIFPHELRAFLEDRGIGLRLTEHGSGPVLWTLENAANEIAKHENWHREARDSLLEQMLEAAEKRELIVRDPHTDLPKNTGSIRDFYELVAPDDVNSWLEQSGSSVTLRFPVPISSVENAPFQLAPEIQAPEAMPVAETPIKQKITWDDHALRRLYYERKTGITQKKLSEQYGISRQGIAKQINRAEDMFAKKKAGFFDQLGHKRKK